MLNSLEEFSDCIRTHGMNDVPTSEGGYLVQQWLRHSLHLENFEPCSSVAYSPSNWRFVGQNPSQCFKLAGSWLRSFTGNVLMMLHSCSLGPWIIIWAPGVENIFEFGIVVQATMM